MKNILIILLTVSIFTGCVHEIDDLTFTTLKPGFPSVHFGITMNAGALTEVGDSVQVREGASNIIEFFYQTEALNTSLSERISIKDQAFNDTIPFSSFLFTAGETNEVKLSEYNSFSIDNTDLSDPSPALTLIELKRGSISVNQMKDFSHEVETILTFPTLTKDGNPLILIVSDDSMASKDLSGYTMDLTGAKGNKTNAIDYEISTTVTESGSSISGKLTFSFEMRSMSYSYLEGDFFTYLFDEVNAEFNLGLPESEVPDNIKFTNPRVNLIVDNSSGMEYGLDITEVSFTKENGDILTVTGSYNDEDVIVQSAKPSEDVRTTEYEINNDNTDNLTEIISDIPQTALFRGIAIANPNGTPIGGNFVRDNSRVVINAEIILPLEGYANNYAINDTINDIDLEFGDEGVVSIDNVNLRFQAENSFPFDLKVQFYFLDSTLQKNVIDSLFTDVVGQTLVPSGTVDGSGLVVSSNTMTTDIIIDQDKYEKVKFSKSIRVKASILTTGADQTPPLDVKFTIDNSLSIGLGISGNAIIDPNQIVNN